MIKMLCETPIGTNQDVCVWGGSHPVPNGNLLQRHQLYCFLGYMQTSHPKNHELIFLVS